MTANAMQGDRDRCLAAGMNDHVAKPIEPDILWKALLRWIKPRREAVTEVKPQAGPDVDLPAGIDGLDMASGLGRVLGRKPLYLTMLRMFAAGQKTAVAEINQALESNIWKTAERVAHTLKGVAGTIGAAALQLLAEKLETAIKEGRPREEVDARLDELKMVLESLLGQLEQQLPEDRGNISVSVAPEQLKVVCDTLERMLTDDDAEAVDVLDAHADLLNVAFPTHYRTIADTIRSFNFEAALVALRAATGTSA
jgi:HPt (histidine-containing phosphotransfer) domain-containing protein